MSEKQSLRYARNLQMRIGWTMTSLVNILMDCMRLRRRMVDRDRPTRESWRIWSPYLRSNHLDTDHITKRCWRRWRAVSSRICLCPQPVAKSCYSRAPKKMLSRLVGGEWKACFGITKLSSASPLQSFFMGTDDSVSKLWLGDTQLEDSS